MEKFLSSKLFVIINTSVSVFLGLVAGYLLGIQPKVYTSSASSYGSYIRTEYVFSFKTALGYWILALLISFLVMLVCILIRNLYLQKNKTECK